MRKRDARREEKGGWAKGRGRETEEDREGEKQEKQGRTSLFRGGCCGINSVKSRRADRERERRREAAERAGGSQPREGYAERVRRKINKRVREKGNTGRVTADGVADGKRKGVRTEREILSMARLRVRQG